MWLLADESSSSHVRMSTPSGPSAAITAGRLFASHVSPSGSVQPAVLLLCVLWQLFG
jgi:hypothetical protein